ncbi:MAG: SPOR domain-containing protein [Pseudomonadota bacterium]
MKVFVMLLVLINLGIFSWYTLSQEGESSPAPAVEAAQQRPASETAEPSPAAAPMPQAELTPVPTAPAPSPEVEASMCYEIGPLEEAPFMTVVAWLDEQVIAFEMTERVVETVANYWVYLDPPKTAKAAQDITKQLKSKGIKDVHVIEAGADKNAVSLGLFKDEGTAKARVKEIKKLGYTVQLKPRTESHTQYLVSLKDDFTKHLSKYVETHPGIAPTMVECE